MALLNLSAGVVIASRPERASDLESIQRWGEEWLVQGVNIYDPASTETPDYPPHGIVALSPLGTLPRRWAVPVWTTVNIALAALAPYLAVRAFDPTIRVSTAALPILMFLCWGGVRTLLQFSLSTLALGLLAMVVADRRPIAAGVSSVWR